MKKATGRALRAYVVAACLAASDWAAAATGTNFADQWWTPAESGWGLSISQQADVLFVELYIYAPDGTPTWYVTASGAYPKPDPNSSDSIFAGDLYRTTGPGFASAFDPSLVNARKVGTLIFDAVSAESARVTYTIDSVTVTKSVSRLNWKPEDFTGSYDGAFVYEVNPEHGGCIGTHRDEPGVIAITQGQDGSFTMTAQSADKSCTYVGTYRQVGHLGTVTGTFSCTGFTTATFTAYEMERSASGMTGRWFGESRETQCAYDGHFGGVQR